MGKLGTSKANEQTKFHTIIPPNIYIRMDTTNEIKNVFMFFIYENKRLNNQRINMIPNAAIAILPMHPAAMHPPAIAPPTASSDFPELA